MYTQLLYYIAALTLFTMQQPEPDFLFTPLETLLLSCGIYLSYLLLCRLSLTWLYRTLQYGAQRSSISTRFHRVQLLLSVLALVVLAIHVYALNIKAYLFSLPVFEHFTTLSGLAGISVFLLYQATAWYWGYPVYKHIQQSSIKRSTYIRGHLAFGVAILTPWLLASILSDLLQFLPVPSFLKSDTGQFVLLGLIPILFILVAPRLVLGLWGCSRMPEGPVQSELQGFLDRHRFRVGGLMLWPLFGGEMLTAGIMGILPRLRYILVTRGLVAFLSLEELKAVLGHEMGHARKYHLVLHLFFFLCLGWLLYGYDDLMVLLILKQRPFSDSGFLLNAHQATLFSFAYMVPVLSFLLIYFRFIFGFFLRNTERQADIFAMQLIGHPYTLISSLDKIGIFSGHIHDVPSWHHYSIRERIEFLVNAHQDPTFIKRHDRKLYGAVLFFVAVVVTLGLARPQIEGSDVVRRWTMEVQAQTLEGVLNQKPDSAEAYIQYGGLLFELGRYGQAEHSLRKALELSPRNPTALNNLAWLYATAPSPFLKPEEALELASKAVLLDPSPQFLDTLAEAHYVNGQYREALEAILQALIKEPSNRDYFLKQKLKFEEALGTSAAEESTSQGRGLSQTTAGSTPRANERLR